MFVAEVLIGRYTAVRAILCQPQLIFAYYELQT